MVLQAFQRPAWPLRGQGQRSWPLVHLLGKQDLAASFSKLVGRETTKAEDSEHAMRCWKFIMLSSFLPRLENQSRTVLKRRCKDKSKGSGEPSTEPKPKKVGKGSAPPSQPEGGKAKDAVKIDIASKAKRNPDDYEKKTLRFQRMVMTDGYNLSLVMTTADDIRGKIFGSRKVKSALPCLDPVAPIGCPGRETRPRHVAVVAALPG